DQIHEHLACLLRLTPFQVNVHEVIEPQCLRIQRNSFVQFQGSSPVLPNSVVSPSQPGVCRGKIGFHFNGFLKLLDSIICVTCCYEIHSQLGVGQRRERIEQ